jgi:hypothetical protein
MYDDRLILPNMTGNWDCHRCTRRDKHEERITIAIYQVNLRQTVDEIKKLGLPVNAAVFNLRGGDPKYFKSPFLETPLNAFQAHWEGQGYFIELVKR